MNLNINYLMRSNSRKLHTAIRLYKSSGELINTVCMRKDLDDSVLFSEDIESALLNADSRIPYITLINETIIYTVINSDQFAFIIGPLELKSGYSINHKLTVNNINFNKEILFKVSWEDYIPVILDIKNLGTDDSSDEISELDIVKYNCLSTNFEYKIRKVLEEELLIASEEGRHHNPYDQEVRELSAIENGDCEALKKSIEEDYTGKIGTLSKNDSLRNIKNIAIVVLTNSSRAAIRGGLSPEIAFSMSDLYIQQIEDAKTENLPLQITRNAEFEYARMVNEIKNSKAAMNRFSGKENEHIMAAKNYIYRHIRESLSVQEIAEALELNANYLSGLFKQCENITLKDFILNGKITLAKNMLTYSAYSYSEIAYYIGFSSQSHLGKQFKKRTGMTLSQYRFKYQLQEFMD